MANGSQEISEEAAPQSAAEAAAEIANLREKALTAAEAIIMVFIENTDKAKLDSMQRFSVRQHFDVNELHVFDALGWDNQQLTKEIGRCKNVRAWQRKAGTSAERNAAREADEAAKEALQNRRPLIEEKIAKLESELMGLESQARAHELEVQTHEQAAAALSELLPPHLEEFIRSRRTAIRKSYGEIAEIESRLAVIDRATRFSLIDREGLEVQYRPEALRNYARSAEADVFVGDSNNVDPAKWQQHVSQLKSVVPTLERDLNDMRRSRESELAEVNAELDKYIPQ